MGNREKWTGDQIPAQEGRIALVTGANSGLGYQISKALAAKGARVIMACRNLEKGKSALKGILAERPSAEPEVWELNLADLGSVKAMAERMISSVERLDMLINNAGLMAIPLNRTRDGFEMQFGVNHLGHFALTASLWPLLKNTKGSRIVNVSSTAHHFGRIRFKDIHWEKSYSKWGAYGMSKLSNLLFTRELAARIEKSGYAVTVAAAHPGYAGTELQAKGAVMEGSKWKVRFYTMANRLVAQPAGRGALPVLYAATAERVGQGAYFGPDGLFRMSGWPAPDRPNPRRVTDDVALKLWGLSEQLTGIVFNI
jgi:NAD(P)-dependent dehydrogenase (short-subunit alcohol dehydrogenase family)